MLEGSLPRDALYQYLTTLYSSRNAVAVILKVAYGYQVAEEGDPFVHIIEEGFRLSNNLVVPGKYWVEFMPFCQCYLELNAQCAYFHSLILYAVRFVPDWFPGAGFKRYAKRAARAMSDIDLRPFVWAKKEIVKIVITHYSRRLIFFVSRRLETMLTHSPRNIFSPKTVSPSMKRREMLSNGLVQLFTLVEETRYVEFQLCD